MNKTVNGTTTQFLYDGLNPVQELNSSNGVVANLLTGLRVDEYFTRTDTATSTFLADALGSTAGLVGSGGTIATSYTYQPFGATTVGGSANGNSYQFTGRENDGTGLYFYRARYYSPTFQRFIAQDPIGFRGGDRNLYGYVSNGPTNFRDARGTIQGWDDAIEIGVGVACPECGLIEVALFAGSAAIAAYEIHQALAKPVTDIPDDRPPFQGPADCTQRGKKQTRRYGPDGYPQTDVDTGHDHGAGDPHAHDSDRPDDGGPRTHEDRGRGRPLGPGDPPPPRDAP
jgi:RHS repeat-associated protein